MLRTTNENVIAITMFGGHQNVSRKIQRERERVKKENATRTLPFKNILNKKGARWRMNEYIA